MEFDFFLRTLHAETRGMDGLEGGWLGKGPGMVVRLAAVLTLLGWSATGRPRRGIVPRTWSRRVTLWSHYFRSHALAVFNQAGTRPRPRRPPRRALAAHHRPTEIRREQIRVEALAGTVDAEGADKMIARLERCGVLRLLPVVKARHRPAKRWAVNPGLR